MVSSLLRVTCLHHTQSEGAEEGRRFQSKEGVERKENTWLRKVMSFRACSCDELRNGPLSRLVWIDRALPLMGLAESRRVVTMLQAFWVVASAPLAFNHLIVG